MKFPAALACCAVRNEPCRLEQDVDLFDSTHVAGQDKERQSRQGEPRQETGASVYLSWLRNGFELGRRISSPVRGLPRSATRYQAVVRARSEVWSEVNNCKRHRSHDTFDNRLSPDIYRKVCSRQGSSHCGESSTSLWPNQLARV